MSLIYSPAARASVSTGTRAVTVTGLDLTPVKVGMTIHFGSAGRVAGDGYIIAAVAPDGAGGGALTIADDAVSGYAGVPFVIDTREFQGNASFLLLATTTTLVNTLTRLLGPAINLFSDSRQIALDKGSPPAGSRVLFAIANRLWAALDHRTLTYSPPGRGDITTEALAVRAYPDGATAVDALLIDLKTGGVDALADQVVMDADATVDLASAPVRRVLVAGAPGTVITSFGAGRRKSRLVRLSAGLVLRYGPSLRLPGAADITTLSGDTLVAESDEAGTWWVWGYQRADGSALTLGPVLRTDTAQILTDLERARVRASIGAPGLAALAGRSILVNGGMTIAQEYGAGGVTVTGNGARGYAVDQWHATTNVAGAAVFAGRVVAPFPTQPNLLHGCVIRCSTAVGGLPADGYLTLQQDVEGQRLAPIRFGQAAAQPVTVAFMVRANFTGRLGCALVHTGGTMLGFDVVADADVFVRLVFPARPDVALPPDNTRRLSLLFGLAAGSSRRGLDGSDTMQPLDGANLLAATGTQVVIGGACLLAGDVAVTADLLAALLRGPAEELALCQRYYAKTHDPDVAPGGGGYPAGYMRGAIETAGGRTDLVWQYPAEMRVRPSLIVYSPRTGTAGAVTYEDSIGSIVEAPAVITAASTRLVGSVNADTGGADYRGQTIAAHFVANARMS